MEKLVIQSDTNNLPLVENFVRAICDDNHIVNYYATISVPVMKAVENVMSAGTPAELTLLFDHCHGGICFTIHSDTPTFSPTPVDEVPPAGTPEEAIYLIATLSDQMVVADEGRTLQMIFELQGIDADEASSRAQVLDHFYESIRSHHLQAVEL